MKHPQMFVLWRSCVACFNSCINIPSHQICSYFVSRSSSVASWARRNACPPLRCQGFQQRRVYSQGIVFLWQNEILQNYMQSLMKEHKDLCETLNLTLKEEERKALSQRHTELSSLCTLLNQIQEKESEVRELEAMFADLNSIEDEQLLREEKDSMNQNINKLREKVLNILVPQNKYDMNDAILEVVSGRTTGGDICQQFTEEVFEMYQNYAYYKGWSFEILNCTPNEYGGVHHAAARIIGEGAYKRLKYEGGVHRVQRIPEVGLSSRMQRIHTGTMSVIVLPQPDEVDIKIDPRDLRIDTFRAKGAGGQHVNTTDSAVRIVHIPTGMSVECQQERSQIQNKEKAMRILRAKLHEQTVKHELSQRQSSRKLQVGTRDQSDRIRTYNFTQDRLTDHRISYDVRNLRAFLDGEELLDELIDKVHKAAAAEDLLEVIENNSLRVQQKL